MIGWVWPEGRSLEGRASWKKHDRAGLDLDELDLDMASHQGEKPGGAKIEGKNLIGGDGLKGGA